MINTCKSNKKVSTLQIAGLHPADDSIEFIGHSETQEVHWMRNGHTLPWEYLPKDVYRKCQEAYLNDEVAYKYLSGLCFSTDRQIELFIYHNFGGIDNIPDFKQGELQRSENFRHTLNHVSLQWNYKDITIDEVVLNDRDLIIIDLMKEDAKDSTIAEALHITTSTFDYHKKNLFKKTGVKSRMGLIIKALNQHI